MTRKQFIFRECAALVYDRRGDLKRPRQAERLPYNGYSIANCFAGIAGQAHRLPD